ncbi:MAG TPA: hypothetical protein VHO90_04820 [Bacteroidales bacterium]|nr:hypothetical protein [Bacteroidales bacterium]
MVRLTDDDSYPRVEDASERHMRLCTQNVNGQKYSNLLKLFYDDFEEKSTAYKKAAKESTFAFDTGKLRNAELDGVLRDVNGRAKEYDRNHPGNSLEKMLFPDGLTEVVDMPDAAEPEEARSISQKIKSLGAEHVLFPYAALLDAAITACETAFTGIVTANKAEGNAKTDFEITKLKLVKQYNDNFFIAAHDNGKFYAEKLFPKLRKPKKEEPEETKPV